MTFILRTQTDFPGRFVVNGRPLTEREIETLLKGYQKSGTGSTRGLREAIAAVINSGLILHSGEVQNRSRTGPEQVENVLRTGPEQVQNRLRTGTEQGTESTPEPCPETGHFYSPRIVQEYEESQAGEAGGKARWGTIGDRAAHHSGHQAGDLDEKRREEKRRDVRSPRAPRAPRKRKTDWGMVDVIADTLGKLEDPPHDYSGKEHPSRPTHVKLTQHIPSPLIQAALADTQMNTRDGQSGARDNRIKNPPAYFWARCVKLATDQDVEIPEHWRKNETDHHEGGK
jgi:hypothetical protein